MLIFAARMKFLMESVVYNRIKDIDESAGNRQKSIDESNEMR